MLEVLLVEDSLDDVEFFASALGRTSARIRLKSVNDGEEGLKYLQHASPFTDARIPDLVVLDVNLPKMSGIEVLGAIKADHRLRSIPVVILSTSDAPDGIGECYCRGAACYLVKPDDLPGWTTLAETLAKYWRLADFAPGHICS